MCRIVRVSEMFLTLTIAAACISPLPAQTTHICCNSEDCAKRQVKPNLRLIETTLPLTNQPIFRDLSAA